MGSEILWSKLPVRVAAVIAKPQDTGVFRSLSLKLGDYVWSYWVVLAKPTRSGRNLQSLPGEGYLHIPASVPITLRLALGCKAQGLSAGSHPGRPHNTEDSFPLFFSNDCIPQGWPALMGTISQQPLLCVFRGPRVYDSTLGSYIIYHNQIVKQDPCAANTPGRLLGSLLLFLHKTLPQCGFPTSCHLLSLSIQTRPLPHKAIRYGQVTLWGRPKLFVSLTARKWLLTAPNKVQY